MKLFKEIQNDKDTINISEKEIVKWEDTMYEENLIKKIKYSKDTDDLDLNILIVDDDIYNNPLLNNIADDELSEQKEIEEEIKGQADKELDEESSDQAKEDFLRDAMEEYEIEQEVQEEVYDNELLKEGDDVMDNAYDYGDPQQGLEDEGNGVDDYSMQDAYQSDNEPFDE